MPQKRLTQEQLVEKRYPKRLWRPWMIQAIILGAEGWGAAEIQRRIKFDPRTKGISTRQGIWRFFRREDVRVLVEKIRASAIEKIADKAAAKQESFIEKLAADRDRMAARLAEIGFEEGHNDRDALRAIEIMLTALGDAKPKEAGSTTNVVIGADLLDRYKTLTQRITGTEGQNCRIPTSES